MALFKRLKQELSSDRQIDAEDGIAGLNDAVDGTAPSIRGKAGIVEREKRDRVVQLTPREYELYLLLLEGFTLDESANKLSVKHSTANTHMSAIYKKLGVRSRAQLIINYHTVAERSVQQTKMH